MWVCHMLELIWTLLDLMNDLASLQNLSLTTVDAEVILEFLKNEANRELIITLSSSYSQQSFMIISLQLCANIMRTYTSWNTTSFKTFSRVSWCISPQYSLFINSSTQTSKISWSSLMMHWDVLNKCRHTCHQEVDWHLSSHSSIWW